MGKIVKYKVNDSLTLVAYIDNGNVLIYDLAKSAESLYKTTYLINLEGQLIRDLNGKSELIATAEQISVGIDNMLELSDDVEFSFHDIIEAKPAVGDNPAVALSCHFEIKPTIEAKSHVAAIKKRNTAIENFNRFINEQENQLVEFPAVADPADTTKNHPTYKLIQQGNGLYFMCKNTQETIEDN